MFCVSLSQIIQKFIDLLSHVSVLLDLGKTQTLQSRRDVPFASLHLKVADNYAIRVCFWGVDAAA
jgi:hypothetical protein